MLYNQFPSRGVIRAGATGAWAPVGIEQQGPGTRPQSFQ